MKYVLNLLLLSITLSASAAGTDDHSHDHELGNESNDHSDADNAYIFGTAGKTEIADRVVQVTMTDNKYDLPVLYAESGETIHFKIKNEGEQIHEFTIATSDMHVQHQAEMLNHISSGHMSMTDKGHGGGHDHANSLLLNPGETGELTWLFAKAESIEFACNVPGHYQSGMVGRIIIRN